MTSSQPVTSSLYLHFEIFLSASDYSSEFSKELQGISRLPQMDALYLESKLPHIYSFFVLATSPLFPFYRVINNFLAPPSPRSILSTVSMRHERLLLDEDEFRFLIEHEIAEKIFQGATYSGTLSPWLKIPSNLQR